MKTISTFLLVIFSSVFSIAQSINGEVTNIFGEPLIGANVYWVGTQISTITDELGKYSIEDKTDGDRTLVFSYVGFKSDSIKVRDLAYWSIQLIEDSTLPEVNISASEMATRYEDAPAKVEVIGTKELERSACCSLAGCFSTNASVDANTTNAITDAKELRILGLSGIYNQVLLDGMPLFEGLSYTYGISSLPGTMIENIYIAKGANSILQGYGGITGQINILPRSAEKADKLYLNAYLNSFGESQYNGQYMHKKSGWNNFTSAHLTLPAGEVDGDEDGFQDVAKVRRFNLYNKWTYDDHDNEKVKSMIGFRYWDEERTGGQLDYNAQSDKGSSGIYGQSVDLSQVDLYGQVNYLIQDGLSLLLMGSGYYQNQESFFGQKQYSADQTYFTSDFVIDYNFGDMKHNIKAGASIKSSDLNEDISFILNPLGLSYDGEYKNQYTVPGIYSEGTFYLGNFVLLSGLRADHHYDIGWKLTPRMLLRTELNERTDLRFSFGKGYRRVHLFPERVNLLASNRDIIFEDIIEPEEAVNLGINLIRKFQIGNVLATITADGYLTFFQNQVYPDYDREVNKVFISNVRDNGTARSFQIDNNWEFSQNLEFKMSYKYLSNTIKVDDQDTDLPLIPKHKFFSQLSTSSNDNSWQADITYKWTGKQRLPDTNLYPDNYKQDDYSPSFTTVDFQVTKRWVQFEVYTGVENIFGFRQDHPILSSDDPFGPFFDSSFNWGPTRGRELYLGIRYKINQE